MKRVPYRIETERLVLRCWSPEDAVGLVRAIEESRAHLSGFMLWAKHRATFDETVALLRGWRAEFDRNEDWLLGVFDRASGALIGGTGLHPRVGPGGIEIGYWIHTAWTRRGIATELTAALTKVAFEVGEVRWVEVRCAKTNTTSARIPQRLGFTHDATLRERLELPDGTFDDALVFSMLRREYDASALRTANVAAFDASGFPLG